jgi:metallophosphoesterase (TIGR00282 family)
VRILFLGDVVGRPGRHAIRQLLPQLRRARNVDFVIANGENSAHGAGLTPPSVEELLQSGVDVITSGDHAWDRKEILQIIDTEPRLLRPLNYPSGTPGQGSSVFDVRGKSSVGVINALGCVFLRPLACPFRATEAEAKRLRERTPIVVVDIHAEATSEKIALARYLDGKVSAVIGTHTHVVTADEQILPLGTAYITDVGMCGPHDSVLGRDSASVIQRFLTQMPQRLEVAKSDVQLNGVFIDVDETTGRATNIERVRVPFEPPTES